jgi:hypothetical protein
MAPRKRKPPLRLVGGGPSEGAFRPEPPDENAPARARVEIMQVDDPDYEAEVGIWVHCRVSDQARVVAAIREAVRGVPDVDVVYGD